MAAAYATLERAQVPRATPMLNVLQRVGGSLGTAVLAVVLQHQLTAAVGHGREGVASAFADTYWWIMAGTAVAIVPALVLARTQRAAARRDAAAPVPSVG